MLTINTNVASLQAQKNLNGAQFGLNKAIDHLSAGLRITSAADDASGLKTAMTTQGTIAALHAAAQSTQQGIAKVQTAEGYLNEATNILIRRDGGRRAQGPARHARWNGRARGRDRVGCR
jgi:flagellin